MATFYLKNNSGSTVTISDLGISLPNNQSLVIDSNNINGWLTNDLAVEINGGNLILSTTDIGDNGGDLLAADAIAALTITSEFDRDNPHEVTITQTIAADSNTDITTSELEALTSGGGINLHHHDSRYYTQTQLSTSNAGVVAVHWNNITDAPQFGALHWIEPVIANLRGMGTAVERTSSSPSEGWYWLDTDDDHLYRYDGSVWVDQGAPAEGDRVIFRDGAGSDDHIYEFDGAIWQDVLTPEDNTAVLVDDDNGAAAQYIFDDTITNPPNWIKLADVAWGDHSALDGLTDPNVHPASSISYTNTISGLTATEVQDAIDELATQGIDIAIDNIVYVSTDGSDTPPSTGQPLGTLANPYATLQAAHDSISGSLSTNRYLIYVMPGDYEENFVLSKGYVYLAGADKYATRIKSSTGTTLTLSNTTENATAVSNITIISSSTSTTDNAILISGNNPKLFNVNTVAISGGRALQITGAHNQSIRESRFEGPVRIEAGVIEFYDSKVVGYPTTILGGTFRVHNGDFNYNGGHAIDQQGGTVYLVSAKLISGTGSNDYNQQSGTVYWGWVEYDDAKVLFSGTKILLFRSGDIFYNDGSNTQVNGDDVQEVINNIDTLIQNIIDNSNTHEGDTTNPHQVTFTQAVTADSGTDITVTEAETLTDGSNADSLHKHDATNITYSNTTSGLTAATVQAAIDELATDSGGFIENVVYVSKNGSDTPGVGQTAADLGTFISPYLTVQAAISSITDASSSKYYTIFVMPGTYVEDLTFKPWVNIVGFSKEGTKIRTGTGTHTLDLPSGGRVMYKNIGLGGETQSFIVDHPAAAPGGCSVYFDNAQVGIFTMNGLGGGVDYFQSRNDTVFSGKVTIHSAATTAYDTTFNGGIEIDDVGVEHVDGFGSASSNTLKDTFSGNMLFQGNTWSELYNTYTWGTITADGADTTVVYDTQSATDNRANLITLNGGTLTRSDNAFAVAYDNTLTGLSANNVQDAIDELNTNISNFQMPQGTSFPPTPNDGDLFYRTDLNLAFQYDGSRNKWLSMTQMYLDWGANNANGRYLNIHGATATQTGYLMPRNGTIISITAKTSSGNQSKDLEIRRNNDNTTPLATFALSGGSYSSTTANVDFSAGDYLQTYASSVGVPSRDIVVMITIAYRE